MKYITPYIASQCPSAGGNAVFQARGVLSLLGYSPDFDDYAACALVQSPWRQLQTEEYNDIAIYPNPTTGEITINYGQAQAYKHWLIFDVLGKELKNGQLSNNNLEKIDLTGYGTGLYFLKIENNTFKVILY